MLFHLLLFLLFCLPTDCILTAAVNSTVTFANGPIENIVFTSSLSGYPNIPPYHFVQQLNPVTGRMRAGFNFSQVVLNFWGSYISGSWGAGRPIYSYTVDSSRVDTEDVVFEVQTNLTVGRNSTEYDAYLQIAYFNRAQSYTSYVVFFFWKGPDFSCSNSLTNITFGNLVYTVTKTFRRTTYHPCNTTFLFNNTIDSNMIARHLISDNLLNPYDTRRTFKFIFSANGSGEYEFVGKMTKIRQNKLLDYGQLLDGYFINIKLYNSYISSQFGNMSMLWKNPTIPGTIFEFMYNVTVPALNTVQAECFVSLGYKDGLWVTPAGEFLLPIPISGRYFLQSNFSFSQYGDTDPANRKAACFMISTRNDYNPATGVFSNPSQIPANKVYICLWSSQNLAVLANEVDITSDGKPIELAFHGTVFRLRQGNDVSGCIGYIFYANSNITSVFNYDLFAFIRYLRDVRSLFANHYVASVSAGFRGYTGRGGFTFRSFSINSILIPSSVLYSTYRFDFAGSKLAPLPVSCPIGSANPALYACIIEQPQGDMAVEQLLNARGVGVAARISFVASLIDEFVYYNYHGQGYDGSVAVLSRIGRNWTSAKWMLPTYFWKGADGEEDIGSRVGAGADGYSEDKGSQPAGVPGRFAERLQWPRFMENTYDFWIIHLPIIVGCFFIVMAIEHLISQCWMAKQAQVPLSLLRPFRSLVYLWSSIVCDNMTYLSFKCFLNLYSFNPFQRDGRLAFTCFSMCCCIFVLFCLIITVICIGFCAFRYSRVRLLLPKRQSIPGCYLLFTYYLVTKFASGFLHVFVLDPVARCVLLFVLTAFPALLCGFMRLPFRRANIMLPFAFFITKSLFHLILLLEVLYRNGQLPTASNEEYMFSALAVITMIIFWLTVAIEVGWRIWPWIVWGPWRRRVGTSNNQTKSANKVAKIDKAQSETRHDHRSNSFEYRMNYDNFRMNKTHHTERMRTINIHLDDTNAQIKKSLKEIPPEPREKGTCNHRQCTHNHLPPPPKSERIMTKYMAEGKKWIQNKPWH